MRIEVIAHRDDRALRERLAERHPIRAPNWAHRIWVVALVIAGAAASIAVLSSSGHSSVPRRAPIGAGRIGPTGVAAAYGYPPRCLSVTISAIDPAFARADFNHGSSCGRYAGDATAIFRRVDRVWRPVLDAVTYQCPVATVPPAVQSELGICP
ncbi:MAG: hypothetical protein JO321_01450 [Solirubrobacterales bacterium]|nr:hypothetical protein [Solirubrobacterales bacterium]